MLTAARIRYPGRALVLGARFAPGAAGSLVAPPPAELVDRVVGLDDLWRGVQSLTDSLASARDDAERLMRMERAFERRMRPGIVADPAAATLEQRPEALRIADLAREAGVSERQLERRFRARLGITAAMARRIARVLRASRMISSNPDTPWQELMHACGFYDQAHLIREFRAFAGLTPRAYADEQRVGFIQYRSTDPGDIRLAHANPPLQRRSA